MNKINYKLGWIGRGGHAKLHAIDPAKIGDGTIELVGACGTFGRGDRTFEYDNTATECLRCNIKLGFLVKNEVVKVENEGWQHMTIGFTQTIYKVIKEHNYQGTDYKAGEFIEGKRYDNQT